MNFLKSLKLQNFRKYTDKEFTFNSQLNIIYAPNATGKTTILEAISVLTNGTSSWTGNIHDLYCYNNPEITDEKSTYFRISGNITADEFEDPKHFAVYQSPTQKKFQIEKQNTTSRRFLSSMAATVFSPEHIELLMISPQQRRNYLDQTLSRIDLDYAEDIKLLKKVVRQRNAYIKKISKKLYESGIMPNVDNDQQFTYWSKQLADVSSKIMVKRSNFMQRLITQEFRIEYVNSLNLNEFELMQELPALQESHLEKILAGSKKDIALGYSNLGAHRDDWNIITTLEVKRFGSRGEKRMAIGQLIFLVQEVLAQELGFYPFLLLDDISSELDLSNIKRILTDEIMEKQQVFITTVSLDGFSGFGEVLEL